MKGLIISTAILMFGCLNAQAMDQAHIADLADGAVLVAVQNQQVLIDIEVIINGKNYPVCRYETNLQPIVCTNPSVPYAHSNTATQGFFRSKGAMIYPSGVVEIIDCKLVYESLGCYAKPY